MIDVAKNKYMTQIQIARKQTPANSDSGRLKRYQGVLNKKSRKFLGFRQFSVVFAALRKAV